MTEAELARLYREYGYVLFRRCLAFLGDLGAAHDAVPEVFVRAVRASDGLQPDADPHTWLSRIADQLCVDVLRRRRRKSTPPSTHPPHGELTEAQLAGALVDDERESFQAVRRVLAGLPPDMQRLALLYYLDGLTQEELARELGLSRRTVAKRVQQLLARARELSGEEQSA